MFISAEADPFELFEKVMAHKEWQALGSTAPPDAVVDDNLGFTKDRTISRLLEMQVHTSGALFCSRYPVSCVLQLSRLCRSITHLKSQMLSNQLLTFLTKVSCCPSHQLCRAFSPGATGASATHIPGNQVWNCVRQLGMQPRVSSTQLAIGWVERTILPP